MTGTGTWIILVWALLGFVFLLKATPFRRLVSRVRRQPPAVQAAAALCLFIAVIVGGTKPGGTNAPSSSPRPAAAAPANNNSPLRTPHASLPSWWADDPTDTDGDGIPDLWEKWTHGNRHVADGGIDRDGDGLTDLEEFFNQTDPRTADTDGDGFDDAFEVAHGMDPIAQEDFTPVEPDENGNGVIDIWEGTSYLYGFTDADNNGFDDCYEAYHLEPASAGNYDVRVDVFTSRSAVLTWTATNETRGIVLPATAGTSVRLRLPFKTDARIELLAEPEGATLPDGELWKARLEASFAPRDGQTAVGTCIVSDDGDIQQTVPKSTSAIVRFPVGTPSTRASTPSGGGVLIDLLEKRFEIFPPDGVYHAIGDDVGPFTVTNAVNIDQNAIQWSADYGVMTPATGGSSTLTVTSVPSDGDEIVVTAEAVLDDVFRAADTAIARLCHGREFSVTDYTPNFSPHLRETASFTVELPGCPHFFQEGWLEGEVMRETTSGWQHVGWLDVSPAQPGHQKRRKCLAGPEATVFWDGVATEGAALADSPAVFTLGKQPFNRALPAVVSGEPVPPPYYTIFFRYREADSDTAEIIAEASTTVHVPQVVKIEMTDETYNEFVSPIVYPDTYWPELIGNPELNDGEPVELYPGSSMLHHELLSSIAQVAQSAMPVGANIRFSTSSLPTGVKTVTIKHRDVNTNVKRLCWGTTPSEHVSWRNTTPSGKCEVYIDRIRFDPCNEKLCVEWAGVLPYLYSTNIFPYSETDLVKVVAYMCVHEVGHTLGLVHQILYGIAGHHNWAPLDWKGSRVQTENNWFMNPGEPLVFRYDKVQGKPRKWFWLNAKYLIFILPSPNGVP